MFTKSHIISEIKRTAQENGGSPLGIARFEAETGIKSSDWMGKFWARWGDALVEAGFQPNVLQGPRSEDDLLECLAVFARELGHFPVANEVKLKARTEPGFPWHNTYSRFGGKQKLAARLRLKLTTTSDCVQSNRLHPNVLSAFLAGFGRYERPRSCRLNSHIYWAIMA